MKKVALAVAAAVGLSAAANAADMAVKARPAPLPIPVWNWTGGYIGVNVGYGWSDANVDVGHNSPAFFGPAFAAGSTPNSYATHPEGFIGGGQIGYNWQASNWVFGLEADIQGTDIKRTQIINTVVPPFVPGFGSA